MPSTPPLICRLIRRLERGFIHLAVFERGDNGGIGSGEHGRLLSGKTGLLDEQEIGPLRFSGTCFLAFDILISTRFEERKAGHPAQDDLSSLHLFALPRAAARQRHRHGLQRGAGQGRRCQIHATPQGPRLFRHLRHARPGLRRDGIVRKDCRGTRSRRSCNPSSSSALAISAWRCCRIAALNRKALKSSPRSTPTRSGNAANKSSSRFTGMEALAPFVSEQSVKDGHPDRARRRGAGSGQLAGAGRHHGHFEFRADRLPCPKRSWSTTSTSPSNWKI